MPTTTTLQDQLAELRMMIDWGDPVQVEAEAAFAAMVSEIMHETDVGQKGYALCNKLTAVAPPRMPGLTDSDVHPRLYDARQTADALTMRLMPGTAEAYDPFTLDKS